MGKENEIIHAITGGGYNQRSEGYHPQVAYNNIKDPHEINIYNKNAPIDGYAGVSLMTISGLV